MAGFLHQQRCGFTITTSITEESARKIGYVVADDANLVEVKLNGGTSDVEKVINRIWTEIDWLEGCLKFASNAIRPGKFFAYIIDLDFKLSEDYYFVNPITLEACFQERDEQDSTQLLHLIKTSIGKETLGIRLGINWKYQ